MDGYTTASTPIPTLCLSDNKFPQVKKLEAGKTYKITLVAKAIEKSESDRGENGIKTHIDLEIVDLKIGNSRNYDKQLKYA